MGLPQALMRMGRVSKRDGDPSTTVVVQYNLLNPGPPQQCLQTHNSLPQNEAELPAPSQLAKLDPSSPIKPPIKLNKAWAGFSASKGLFDFPLQPIGALSLVVTRRG